MNKIVGEHVPAERLSAELREGLDSTEVAVTIKAETPTIEGMNLEGLFSLRRDVFSSAEEAARYIRTLRDQWDE